MRGRGKLQGPNYSLATEVEDATRIGRDREPHLSWTPDRSDFPLPSCPFLHLFTRCPSLFLLDHLAPSPHSLVSVVFHCLSDDR